MKLNHYFRLIDCGPTRMTWNSIRPRLLAKSSPSASFRLSEAPSQQLAMKILKAFTALTMLRIRTFRLLRGLANLAEQRLTNLVNRPVGSTRLCSLCQPEIQRKSQRGRKRYVSFLKGHIPKKSFFFNFSILFFRFSIRFFRCSPTRQGIQPCHGGLCLSSQTTWSLIKPLSHPVNATTAKSPSWRGII